MPREWAAPLVARGQLRIIGEDQLTLDFDEFAERLERLCGENFPLPVLRHIFSITGGWSVAIQDAAAYILASSNWSDATENFPAIWPDLSHRYAEARKSTCLHYSHYFASRCPHFS